MYLIIVFVSDYLIVETDEFIEGKNGSKYLVFGATDENREVLKKYIETLWWVKNEV